MESLSKSVYNVAFRRTSTWVLAVVGGAFAFDRIVNRGGDYVFERLNKGVRSRECLRDAHFCAGYECWLFGRDRRCVGEFRSPTRSDRAPGGGDE